MPSGLGGLVESRQVLTGRHRQQGAAFVHETECLMLATGYAMSTRSVSMV
jgi:lysine/ornithine N-monooxygenase